MTQYLAVGEAPVAVTGDHLAIVTDTAVAAVNIDEARVERRAKGQPPACAKNSLLRRLLRSTPP